MNIKKMSTEELELMSHTDIAYNILKGEEITSESSFTKEGYETVTVDGNLVIGNAPLVFDADNVDDYPF